MFWNLWKNNFPIFAVFNFLDMVVFGWHPGLFSLDVEVTQEAQKTLKKYQKWPIVFLSQKIAMFWDLWKTIFQFLRFWIQWDMFNFEPKIHRKIYRNITTKILVLLRFCLQLDQCVTEDSKKIKKIFWQKIIFFHKKKFHEKNLEKEAHIFLF